MNLKVVFVQQGTDPDAIRRLAPVIKEKLGLREDQNISVIYAGPEEIRDGMRLARAFARNGNYLPLVAGTEELETNGLTAACNCASLLKNHKDPWKPLIGVADPTVIAGIVAELCSEAKNITMSSSRPFMIPQDHAVILTLHTEQEDAEAWLDAEDRSVKMEIVHG